MLFQLSVNRAGLITGGSESILTGDQKAVAGSVNKETQDVAWRIGRTRKPFTRPPRRPDPRRQPDQRPLRRRPVADLV